MESERFVLEKQQKSIKQGFAQKSKQVINTSVLLEILGGIVIFYFVQLLKCRQGHFVQNKT